MKLSDQELSILRELQRDASLSLAELSDRCSMAQSTLWRKLQDLEASGVIKARVAVLDPAMVDAKLCVLASVSLHDHTEEAVNAFTSLVQRLPQIMECQKVSGEADYMLKIRTNDVDAYEQFMSHNLLRNPYIRSVTSSFVLKDVKSTTALPL
ncbi:Lrp/AsnC family transcriptional regulator [uncultured Litoreibacter sp.]|uniref:Lrp/AsnC family transcriptional regulator n=1 Tax=uncultured Litoreibacter sp. TaxID=1392394 RepID=UPI00261851C4|nr:Lrp/AsnC family transcriptional regulator [uncultured Litoreibacter sp.]